MAATCEEINWIGVGSAVRDRRSASGLSPEDAAHKLCLSKKQILALESGSSAPFPGASVRSWCGRRYAVLLGLDWERLVQAPPSEDQAVVAESIPASALPVEAEAVPATGRGWSRAHLLLVGAVLLLMVAIGFKMAVKDSSPPATTPVAQVAAKLNSPVVAFSSAYAAAAGRSATPVDRLASANAGATRVADPAEITNRPGGI